MKTQVEIVGVSAFQADSAGSIPVTRSHVKPTLTRAGTQSRGAAHPGAIPQPIPNAHSFGPDSNRTYRPSSGDAGELPHPVERGLR